MNTSPTNSLYRTFHPKHPTYFSAGCGRDTFIVHNDGGFIKTSQFPKA